MQGIVTPRAEMKTPGESSPPGVGSAVPVDNGLSTVQRMEAGKDNRLCQDGKAGLYSGSAKLNWHAWP